jgi:hypothetical protein
MRSVTSGLRICSNVQAFFLMDPSSRSASTSINERSAKRWRRITLRARSSPLGVKAILVAGFESTTPLHSLDDTLFPTDGSHYRVAQLWTIFGITVPVVPESRLIARIDELVENRNAIAHGRRTPQEVGGRYSTSDIEKRIDDIEITTVYLVTEMENHYNSGGIWR